MARVVKNRGNTSMGVFAQTALKELSRRPPSTGTRAAPMLRSICRHLGEGILEDPLECRPPTIATASVRIIRKYYRQNHSATYFDECYTALCWVLAQGGTQKELRRVRAFIKRLGCEFWYHRVA